MSARAGGTLGGLSVVCEATEVPLDRAARLGRWQWAARRALYVGAELGMFELPYLGGGMNARFKTHG